MDAPKPSAAQKDVIEVPDDSQPGDASSYPYRTWPPPRDRKPTRESWSQSSASGHSWARGGAMWGALGYISRWSKHWVIPVFFWEMILKNNPQCSNCIKLPLLKVTTSWYNDTSQGICFCFGGLFSYLFYSIGSVFCGGVQWVTIHEGMTRYPFVLTKRDCMMILCHCWLLWNGKYLHQHKYMCQVRTCPGLPSVGDLTLDAGSSYSSTGDTRAGDARGS